jgi:predicted TIM-barrel fold metal-dependent hydrolase
MTYRRLFATILIIPLLWSGRATQPASTPSADHHIHIPSETTAEHLRNAADFDIEAKSGKDVVRFLDETGIEKGVLLSLAYMFGRPGAGVSNEYAKVRRENDYVARQAAHHPDRLVAFCSVNPLAEYALKELARCARKPHLEGLKLQLANSKVDLRDTTDVRRLAEVFAAANRHDLPVVVHLWTGSGYGRREAQIFIRTVLPEAPDVTVQVAHMAGPGMFGTSTVEAMKAFEQAIQDDAAAVENVVFDLGAVTADPEDALAQGDTARAESYRKTHRRTARWIKRVGPDRIVFGADYFARSVPEYVATLRDLPLDDDLLRAVFDNTAPYLDGGSS